MIEARNVTVAAGDRVLLRDLSFSVRRGEFIAILGPNGVGKTTLLRALAGVREPRAGSIEIDGRSVSSLHPFDRARSIAHIPADDSLFEHLVVRDVVAMGRYSHHRWWQWHEEARDESAIGNALDAVDMTRFAARSFDTLSSGERQRVWIAMGLAQEAPLLLLDEPTSHLDVRAAHEILALLRAQTAENKSIACVLHDINEAAEFADRILVLGEGTLLAIDTPDAVLSSTALERAYGVRMETMRSPSGALRVFPSSVRDRRARQA